MNHPPPAPPPPGAESILYASPDPGPLAAATAPGGLDVVRLARTLLRRWRLIALCLVLAAGAAVFYLSKAAPLYEASALVELSARRPRILTQQAAVIEDPASAQQSEATLNTQLEKFKSAAILPAVLACYHAANPNDLRPEAELLAWLSRGVDFKLVRRTRLVAVTFRDTDPARAMRACTAFAQGAEDHARAENRAASDAAVAWLEAQVKVQRAELEKADQTLAEARAAHQMDALEAERKTIQQALLQFNEALVEVESQVAKEQELLNALDRSELVPERAGQLPASLPRADEIQEALSRWMTAVTERDSLLSKYRPEHPEVAARVEAINLYHRQARAALERTRATTASNLELYKRQADSLRQNKEAQSRRAAQLERDLVERESGLASLRRARDAADLSYQGVLNRIQEARLSADENTASVKLASPPTPPRAPVAPRRLLVLAAALLLGGLLGGGLALGLERRADLLSDLADLERGAGIKILAVIPRIASKSRREVATACMTQRFSEVAEAFSGLRSVLDSQAYRGQSQVILVASSLPAEGKTMTCCNLATSCARNGQRTLLLDFDLRRPRIASIYPPPDGRRDMLDYLSDPARTPDELVYETECPHLSVLPSRAVTDRSPEELLGRGRLEALIAWARARYDRILIDGPPLGLVSEALVLAGVSDCVLMVARPSVSRRHALQHSVLRLRDIGTVALAAVVNDVHLASTFYRSYGPYHLYRREARAYFTERDPG